MRGPLRRTARARSSESRGARSFSSKTLPPEPNALVGRASDVAALRALFEGGARLVTIVGPPGAGKTRLALRFAHEASGDPGWTDTRFCDLSMARSEQQVLDALARGIGGAGCAGSGRRSIASDVARAIAALERALVVIDNFEQVTDAGVETLRRLLSHPAISARFLVTSRELLTIEPETVYELGPLAMADAIALFTSRWRAGGRRPRSRADDLHDVAAIVAELDGLPLAIELCAAQADVLPLGVVLERLETSSSFLESLRRDAPSRHRTMRAAVEWSWQLLGPAEKGALHQCAAFHGSWSLEAAERVIDLGAASPTVLDVLRSLERKSLLHVSEPIAGGGRVRFGMFRCIRELALERLEASGEAETVAARHRELFEEAAEQWAAAELGPDERRALDAIECDRANLVAAFERARDRAPRAAVKIALALRLLCRRRGFAADAPIFDAAVATADASGEARLRVKALTARAEARLRTGALAGAEVDVESARQHAERANLPLELSEALRIGALVAEASDRRVEAVSRARRALDLLRRHEPRAPLAEADAVSILGHTLAAAGDAGAARECHERALEVQRRLGAARSVAIELRKLAGVASMEGHREEALAYTREAVAIHRSEADLWHESMALMTLAHQLHETGALDEARRTFADALALHRSFGSRRFEAMTLAFLGALEIERRDLDAARRALDEALAIARETGDRGHECFALERLALRHHLVGRNGLGLSTIESAVSLATRLRDPLFEASTLSVRARIFAAAGRAAEARTDVERARVLFREARNATDLRCVSLDLVEAYVELEACGDDTMAFEHAVRHARALVDRARRAQPPVSAPARRSSEVRIGIACVERAIASRRSDERILEVARDGSWFSPPGSAPILLGRRRALPHLLVALAQARERICGEGLAWDRLLVIGWRDERMDVEAGFKRVRTAIWSLRRLGLSDALVTQGDGYLIHPSVRVRWAPPQSRERACFAVPRAIVSAG